MAMDFNVSPQSIIDLMLRQGEIEAQRKREEIAQNELERQRKHAWARNTLKTLAFVGPMFLPGGGLWPLLAKAGLSDVVRRTVYPTGTGDFDPMTQRPPYA